MDYCCLYHPSYANQNRRTELQEIALKKIQQFIDRPDNENPLLKSLLRINDRQMRSDGRLSATAVMQMIMSDVTISSLEVRYTSIQDYADKLILAFKRAGHFVTDKIESVQRTVLRAIKKLIYAGYIEVTKRYVKKKLNGFFTLVIRRISEKFFSELGIPHSVYKKSRIIAKEQKLRREYDDKNTTQQRKNELIAEMMQLQTPRQENFASLNKKNNQIKKNFVQPTFAQPKEYIPPPDNPNRGKLTASAISALDEMKRKLAAR